MGMNIFRILGTVFLIGILMAVVYAEPYGPNEITRVEDERGNLSNIGAVEISAQGGNVTQLEINATSLTNRWQGYYGNISGQITLDDAQGNTFYDWSSGPNFAPVGNVYAANQSVTDWTDVICLNLTADNVATEGINNTILEAMYGMESTDGDGVDETFSGTEDIVVGATTLTDCPSTNIYTNSSSLAGVWNETLLTENQTNAVIFATEIEQDTFGFDNRTWDFQMMVGENGDVSTPTTYYFYVELS